MNQDAAELAKQEDMPRLALATHVTGDYLARAEADLIAILDQRLMAYRRRFLHFRPYAALLFLLKPLSVFGLLLSLFLVMMGGVTYYAIRVDLVFVLAFALALVFFWDRKKVAASVLTRFPRYWRWLARSRAARMLKVARKAAPFRAEYDLRGDLAVYYRTRSDSAKLVWMRKLQGYRKSGAGFTVFFKRATSIYPYAIVLHEPSAQFEAYLDALGLAALPDVQ